MKYTLGASLILFMTVGCSVSHGPAAPTPMRGVGSTGGGGAFICQGLYPKYPGYSVYIADYVLDFTDANSLSPATSLKDDIARIRGLLSTKAPDALGGFDDFFRAINLSGQGDDSPFLSTANRIWRPIAGSLKPMQYGDYLRYLPKNCLLPEDPRTPLAGYLQLVVRTHLANGIQYDYNDPDFFPGDFFYSTQGSILLVHEWLWDIYETKDSATARIRGANAFLHSQAAALATPEEFRKRVFMADPGT